ncbi:hypothetical protein [Paenibacillus polymyxa]|uniref:hypothetical protein n=1 Tax=Paenibacillus polymyxa TaxID=1406 RepID=UPI00111AEB6D|nr:hypothetical protein [Paenibacillus polymyxa]QDA30199.1 hypothetical protein FGY93_25095 [Paenibacillus polymyxa]
MLPDRERKLLRILYNYFSVRRRMPGMIELKAKTGGDEVSIHQTLQALADEKYIIWEEGLSVEQIVILEGWERKPSPDGKQPLAPHIESDLSYWTKY